MTRNIRSALVLSLAAATALSAQQPSTPPAPGHDVPEVTFRVEVNYVEVDAFVTDAQGNPVTNLTANDFALAEEGVPQAISSFAMVNLPLERSARPLYAEAPVEPDARSNATSEGRIYLVLLDDLHVHPTRAARVRTILRQFIEQNFGVNDLAAVVSARGSSADSQDFTNNPRLLLKAIDRFSGKVPFNSSEALVILGEAQSTPADPAQQEEAQRARMLMQSIRTLADFMAGVRGRRKTMILVSEGIGYDIYNTLGLPGSAASGVFEDSEKAVSALTRANVAIYTIDPRGMLDAERLADPTLSSLDADNFRRAQDSLRVLSAETGGFATVNQNDLSSAFDRIVRENSVYYILGYYPSNDRRDGKFRNVEVRVTRPGVIVQSRRGYLAPRGTAPRESAPRPAASPTVAVASALSSPLPIKGVPIRLSAAPYRGSSQKAIVDLVIEFDPSVLGFTQVNGAFTEDVEVMHSATEPGGRVHKPVRHGLKMTFLPDRFEQAKARGIRVLSQMELAPGRYQLRAAVGNRDGATGSVLVDLEVPDFRKGRFEMSGLAVASAALSSVATVRPSGKARASLPGPMVAAREFESSDTLVLYGEVYENVPATPPHTIDITSELRADDGHAITSVSQQHTSTERKVSGGYAFSFQLDLKSLKPGLYVVHVEGRSNLGQRPTATRQVLFRVTPALSDDCKALKNGCRVAAAFPEAKKAGS